METMEAKKLSDFEFADLFMVGDNAFFKGVLGYGVGVMPVPKECDLKNLKRYIAEEFVKRANTRQEDGIRHIPICLKIEYENIRFRVADMRDVEEQEAWFLRRLPTEMSTLSKIGFPENFIDWVMEKEQNKGIILITGNQSSGKTTLASTLLAERLNAHGGHAVTFEFPAEMPLNGGHGERGYCVQSEINGEVALANSIERSYRYGSPNIVYIGEIRTKHAATEVLRLALSSSQQLIIATLHGQDIVSALERLIIWATEIEGVNASKNLADSLLAVFHTELEITDEEKILHIPEFLLAPFDKEESMSIRAKIRDEKLIQLKENINSQRNRVKLTENNKIVFD